MAESTTLEPPGASEPNATSFPKELLTALATQLEYYFSEQNLRRDTYLSTLRELNDGCVPATILSQFGKVQALLGAYHHQKDAYHAVLEAARQYSDELMVVRIDKDTGKQMQVDNEATTNTTALLCVGTNTRLPIPVVSSLRTTAMEYTGTSTTAVATTTSPVTLVQTTIILRDVPSLATDKDVRQCFDFNNAPAIISVHEDVANCWFVTLDSSSSRDDMVRVMMELRTKNILGESVKARLKTASSTTTQSNTITSAPLLYSGDRNLVYQSTPTQIPSKNGIPKNKKSSHSKPPASPKKPKARREKSPKAQLLSSSQFPSLGDHDEKPLSDGASTATTTSTTSTVVVVESQPTAVFGYAAALLKPAPPPLPPKVTEKVTPMSNGSKQVNEKKPVNGGSQLNKPMQQPEKEQVKEETVNDEPVKEALPKAVVPWGGGKSFADVLKQESVESSSS